MGGARRGPKGRRGRVRRNLKERRGSGRGKKRSQGEEGRVRRGLKERRGSGRGKKRSQGEEGEWEGQEEVPRGGVGG